jgi:two-component system sensor histidine kinase/response regulator
VAACPVSIKWEDLSRIVEELVDNAFKFSRQGTHVNIEFNSEGQLSVTDQGRGVTAEQVSQIGAFRQFDRKKHEQQGLGLGLVLVQKLATLSQATFSAVSKPGEGTSRDQKTFCHRFLRLPERVRRRLAHARAGHDQSVYLIGSRQ